MSEREARGPDESQEARSDTSRSEGVVELHPGNLETIVGGEGFAVVGFGVEWCGKCDDLREHLEELDRETDAAVGFVDVEDHPELLARHQGLLRGLIAKHVNPAVALRPVPWVIVFEDGEVDRRLTGEDALDVRSWRGDRRR